MYDVWQLQLLIMVFLHAGMFVAQREEESTLRVDYSDDYRARYYMTGSAEDQ